MKQKYLNLVIFGPPGAGKDTQIETLLKYLKIKPIETGAAIRDMIKTDTPVARDIKETMARGDLVNDSMMEALIKDSLRQVNANMGLVMDGYPRTIKQAETLNLLLKFIGRQIDRVIFLDVPEEELVRRLSQRKICQKCGATAFPQEEVCSKCGGELVKRLDDNLDSIKMRIHNYHTKTEPIIHFYEKRGLLLTVNGNQAPENVSAEMLKGLGFDPA